MPRILFGGFAVLATRYYYPARSYYGLILIVCFGFLAAAIMITLWLPPTLNSVLVTTILLGMARYLFFGLFLCLRVDDEGIAQRRWLRLLGDWDVWTWEDFASGRIVKFQRWMFSDPLRPWGRGAISLNWLQNDDQLTVLRLINACYELPPVPAVPTKPITVPFGFISSVTFDASGVHLRLARRRISSAWAEVVHVRIVRMDSLRHDFVTLELTLPSGKYAWTTQADDPTAKLWQTHDIVGLNSLLLAHVPAERIETAVRGQRPFRRQDVECHLSRSLNQRSAIILLAFCLMCLSGLLAFAAVAPRGIGLAILVGASVSATTALPFAMIYRVMQARVRRWRQELPACV